MTGDWEYYIAPKRAAYFEPLCRTLRLTPDAAHVHADVAFSSASAGNVRIHFEHDRGLCAFAIGPVSDRESLCNVEELAARFPRQRQLAEGSVRLSLNEQVEFILSHWENLQIMFSPEHVAETRRWRQAQGEAFVRRLRGDS
jgi:hypothetical protein